MLFFRSEEDVRAWCSDRGHPLRPRVGIPQLWKLSHTWYADRLSENPRRRTPEEMRDVLFGLGFEGEFWDPTSTAFGP